MPIFDRKSGVGGFAAVLALAGALLLVQTAFSSPAEAKGRARASRHPAHRHYTDGVTVHRNADGSVEVSSPEEVIESWGGARPRQGYAAPATSSGTPALAETQSLPAPSGEAIMTKHSDGTIEVTDVDFPGSGYEAPVQSQVPVAHAKSGTASHGGGVVTKHNSDGSIDVFESSGGARPVQTVKKKRK